MGSIQFGGLATGLSTSDIIDALMVAQRAPLERLQAKQASLTTKKESYERIGTFVSALLTKVKAFTVSGAGSSHSASSSDTSVLTASASTTAAAGQYKIGVERLATSTKATSTGAVGTAITSTPGSWDAHLADLNLPGSITAGKLSVVVGGVVGSVTVGDPTTTSLESLAGSIASKIQELMQASDPTATVAASVVDNKLRFSVSSTSPTSPTVRFGAAGDTSNALGILGLGGGTAYTFDPANPISGSTSLGVVRTSGALDSAGLTGLTSTAAGKLTINGVDIAYDTTTDSLSTVIGRINASSAGVVASLDRSNDRIVLTSKTSGATAMNIVDTTGTLGAALGLAPGTTNAQVIGQTARITVDGTAFESASNHITTAIDGVSIDLLSETEVGKTATVTVGVDRSAVKSAIQSFVSAFNTLGDALDTETLNVAGTLGGDEGTTGALATDPTMRRLFLSLREVVSRTVSGLDGTYTSLGSIGITTGAVGATTSATKRLQLDQTKLDAALDADPARVAYLLNDAAGAMKPLQDKLDSLTGTNGVLTTNEDSLETEITRLNPVIERYEYRVEKAQEQLERKYAALEALIAQLNTQQSSLSAQVSSFYANKD